MKQSLRKILSNIAGSAEWRTGDLDWSTDWNRRHPRPTAADLVEFWCADQLKNITPPSSPSPAGYDEAEFLKKLVTILPAAKVVEIGCGFGRLAVAFAPEVYLGLDVNPEAVNQARRNHPNYRFEIVDFHADYPSAELYLAYTVFLHIDDQNLQQFNRRLATVCQNLLIVEVLDPVFRKRPSAVPNFVRSRADYEKIFTSFDFIFEVRKPYRHYPGRDISYLVFVNKNTEAFSVSKDRCL